MSVNKQERHKMTDTKPLWDTVEKTDPKYTKTFTRGGGFSGTAINATWLAKRASETFGPMGQGWGVNIIEEKIIEGAPWISEKQVIGHDKIHQLRICLWYNHNGKRGEVYHFGQTTFVGRNSKGVYTDEEAPKKSLTDATTKALSMLGFAADVHMGLFDDNKYVNDRKAEEAAKEAPTKEDYKKQRDFINQINACKDTEALVAWLDGVQLDIDALPPAEAQMVMDQYENRLAQIASGVTVKQTYKFGDVKEMNAWMLEARSRIDACDTFEELQAWQASAQPQFVALDTKRRASMQAVIDQRVQYINEISKNLMAGG